MGELGRRRRLKAPWRFGKGVYLVDGRALSSLVHVQALGYIPPAPAGDAPAAQGSNYLNFSVFFAASGPSSIDTCTRTGPNLPGRAVRVSLFYHLRFELIDTQPARGGPQRGLPALAALYVHHCFLPPRAPFLSRTPTLMPCLLHSSMGAKLFKCSPEHVDFDRILAYLKVTLIPS